LILGQSQDVNESFLKQYVLLKVEIVNWKRGLDEMLSCKLKHNSAVHIDLEKGNNYSVSANFTGHNPKEGGVVARSTILGIDISTSAREETGNMGQVNKNKKLAQQSRVYFKYNLYDNGTIKERWGSFPKPMNNWVFHNDGIFFDDVPPIEP